MTDEWCSVATKNKNNKAQRDAVKAEKAAAEASRVAALKATAISDRPIPKNKGTVLCRNFISPEGCKRGDLCNFRHSVEPVPSPLGGSGAPASNWRRQKEDSTEETGHVGGHHGFHPFLSPAIRERVEKAKKMELGEDALTGLADIDFAANPLEKAILHYLYAHPVTSQFEVSFQQAESNFVNLQVSCHLSFDENIARPSLIDFTEAQLQSLNEFLSSKNYLKDIAQLGGIFTWAEGDFRQKTIPQYHGNLRVCKFKLMEQEAASRSNLLEAMLHTFEYTLSEMFFDYHVAKEDEVLDVGQSSLLNVRRRLTPDGKPSDVFLVRREVDGMQLGLWDSLKSHHFNTLWFPLTRSGFRKSVGSPGSWYKLPTEDHPTDDRYFLLFGFDDRESKKVQEVATTVEEKAEQKNAKFLRFVEESVPAAADKKSAASVKRRIKATKNRAEASKFFQDGNDGTLYLVTGEGETETRHLLKAPLVRKRNLDEQDVSGNPYFKDDLDALRKLPTDIQLWNRAGDKDALTIEQVREFVLIHPFLPIIAIKNPKTDDATNETLKRLQSVLRGLRTASTNQCPDCEVIVYLSNLNGESSEIGPSAKVSTAIPGFNAEDFPAQELDEWRSITAYTWLLPSVFYQSGLLRNEEVSLWLKNFEEKGEKFKVVS